MWTGVLFGTLCFWVLRILEKTLESPLDCKNTQPVHPKGDQSWVLIGKTDAEAEAPILWPPHAKSWLIGKDPNAGKDWRWEEKGTAEDEMVGWHHLTGWMWLEQAPGVGDGQGGLACCSPWSHKELDTIEQLKWTDNGPYLAEYCVYFSTHCLHLLLLSWLQSGSAVILEPKKRKSVTTSTFSPSICHVVMGLDAMILLVFFFFNIWSFI